MVCFEMPGGETEVDGMLVGDTDDAGGIGEEVRGGGVVFEGKNKVRLHLDNATDGPGGSQDTDFGQLQEVLDGSWGPTKQVDEVFFKLVEVFRGLAGGQAAIDIHPLAVGGDITAGDICADVQFEVGDSPRGGGFMLLSPDSRSEQLTVHFVADGIDMPTLLAPEDIASAADFQIAQGDTKSGAELRIFLDGLKAFSSGRINGAFDRQEQIGVGPVFVATDPTAELVEFGQAEPVGIVDDDGIGVGDIQAGFDDGGTDEDVRPVVDKP